MQNTILLASIITSLLAAWKIPAVRDGLFDWVKRWPAWAQPIPPMLLAGLAAAGQGYLDGIRGEALLDVGAASAGQAGVYAVGLWHVAKRWAPVLVRLWRSMRKQPVAVLACFIGSVPLTGCVGMLEESRASAKLVYVGPVAVAKARNDNRCQSLSDRKSLAGGIAVGAGIASGAAGISTWPAKSDRVENALAWGAGAALIVAGTAKYFEGSYETQWSTECSH